MRRFTLLELVAVLAVMALTAAVAVSTFRSESPSLKLKNAALAFRNFCGTARFFAMEDGSDVTVLFSPSEKQFSIRHDGVPADSEGNPLDEDSLEDTADGNKSANQLRLVNKGRIDLHWQIPEGFVLNYQNEEDENRSDGENDAVEMFRFFPDGGAGGMRTFELKCGSLSKSFEISPLTGQFLNAPAETVKE